MFYDFARQAFENSATQSRNSTQQKRRTKEFETIYTYMKMVYEFEYSLLYSDDINSFNLRGFSALQIQL